MKVSTLTVPNYDGGLNDTSSATEIARNEASLLRNWDITYAGQLRRRNGLVEAGIFPLEIVKTEAVAVGEAKSVTVA